MPKALGDYKPGFQRSVRSDVEVVLYRHEDPLNPVILSPTYTGLAKFDGKGSGSYNPSLIAASTSKAMGSASGTFNLTVKRSKMVDSLFKNLSDDCWIDITFKEYNRSWHTLRGIIDEIRETKATGGDGTTTETFTISGRDFGKIWEITPVWFSPYATGDITTETVVLQVFQGVPEFFGSPAKSVYAFMQGFLEKLAIKNGPNWNPPKTMPGISATGFLDSVAFTCKPNADGSSAYYQNAPPRFNFNPGGMSPQGTLWDLAQQYSDPLLTELWVDVLPGGDPLSPAIVNKGEYTNKDTKMTVVFRDKPFPFLDPKVDLGFAPTWDDIPIINVRRQEIVSANLGKSGYERYNAFYTTPLLDQELLPQYAIYSLAPLIDMEDVKRNGIRRFDAQSNVQMDYGKSWEAETVWDKQRNLLKDWYCLNPHMLSGTIALAHGRPDIKIGCRITIPGVNTDSFDGEPEENYYVEQVDHNWEFMRGTRTTLGVTRGWLGTNAEFMQALGEYAYKYTVTVFAPELA